MTATTIKTRAGTEMTIIKKMLTTMEIDIHLKFGLSECALVGANVPIYCKTSKIYVNFMDNNYCI